MGSGVSIFLISRVPPKPLEESDEPDPEEPEPELPEESLPRPPPLSDSLKTAVLMFFLGLGSNERARTDIATKVIMRSGIRWIKPADFLDININDTSFYWSLSIMQKVV